MQTPLGNHIVLALLHEQHGRIQDAIDLYGRVIGVLDWIKEAVPPPVKRGPSSVSRTSPLGFLAREEAERERVEAVYGGVFRRGVECVSSRFELHFIAHLLHSHSDQVKARPSARSST